MRALAASFVALLVLVLSGCSSLLPRGVTESQESWKDYESAKAAIERIVPYESRLVELKKAGIDPAKNPTITILNY